MEGCIFCKIAKKEVSSEMVFESEELFAFKDIKPLTPVHVLLIPKKHLSSMNEVGRVEEEIMGKMMVAAVEIAKKLGIAEDGYKLLLRVGSNGGQEVQHVHLHLLGGGKMQEEIRLEQQG